MKNKNFTKTEEQVRGIAESGRILGRVLHATAALVRPGISTAELNAFAEEEIRKAGAVPSFKGYGPKKNPFPAGLCTSLNDVVVHGVPSNDPLKEGDVIGLDLGVQYKGFYTDAALTVPVGRVSATGSKLIETTRRALDAAVAAARPGARMGDVSHAMQSVAEAAGFSIVRDLIGHGVGLAVHEEPEVPCFGKPGTGIELMPGLVIAIEPMLCERGFQLISDPKEWPVRTADGGLTAHFEHTVAVTPEGPRILTLPS
jgi:methionyl aminopeptidase